MPPVSPARVSLPDRYRVVRHLANGGMASVWEAHDELLGRDVAVKVLASHLAEDERARRRFQREARAAAGLSSHPHVVTIYDVGEHDGRAFMVMELMPGGSAADRLRAGADIQRPVALRWLREAAAALDAAHDEGIVHRDIKPGNLLLDERDRLAIADFGIARLALEEQLTATGQVLGTAAYISPEQAMGESSTAASDRYALTVVAFELLTGSRPFQGEHFAAQARAHVEAPVPSASERRAGLPKAVDAVVERGMAKEPGDRWPTAAALVQGLDDALGSAPATAPTRRVAAPVRRSSASGRGAAAGAVPPGPPRAGRRADRAGAPHRGGLVALVAVAALLALGGVAYALFGGGGGGAADDRPAAAKRHRSATAERKRDRAATPTPTPTAHAAAPATATPTPPVTTAVADLGAARDLQIAGYDARRAGDDQKALELSRQALAACGEARQVDPCGYAAYELGRALNRTGHPAEAIPYLQARLAYGGNDTAEVAAELASAQHAAAGSKPGKGPKKDKYQGGGD